MSDPLTIRTANPVAAPGVAGPAAPPSKTASGGDDFAGMLREQLEQVSRMQTEADDSLQKLLTGQSQNVTDVFVAARKADVAFSLLMEIRNKLVDAYQELQNLRV